MLREKLTVSWDDVNSPDVDARLREQEAKSREDAFTSPALSMNAHQLKTQQRTSIWYNTVFAMAFFGCLGGLLAWGAGELIQLKLMVRAQYLAQLSDAQEKWEAILALVEPGGIIVKDDMTPGRAVEGDEVREFLLRDPRLAAAEILATPEMAVIVAVRLPD